MTGLAHRLWAFDAVGMHELRDDVRRAAALVSLLAVTGLVNAAWAAKPTTAGAKPLVVVTLAPVAAAQVPQPKPTPIGACCRPAPPGPLKVREGEDGISVRADGSALPAGHADDVYYTGLAPSRQPLSPGYRFWPITQPLHVRLKRLYPLLGQVRFRAYHTRGRSLAGDSEVKMAAQLHRLLGADVRLSRLGQGGHQVVWKACKLGGKDGARCVVAKVRKIRMTKDAAERAALARKAAAGLRRDLALFRVAFEVTARARLLDGKGKPSALRIGGKLVRPARPADGPPGRFARVARLMRREALAEGVLVQELVALRPSAKLRTMMHGLEGPDGALRDQAWTNAPKYGVNRVRVLGFLDRYKRVSRIGPDVIRMSAFVRDCHAMQRVPTLARFCRQVREDFRIPDDFLVRVRALEQLYRDSAGAVMRFHRANFEEAVGNPGLDGRVREVGLDYNHGRNVGWDPDTMLFVLFDA